MIRILIDRLPRRWRNQLRAWVHRARLRWVQTFRSYDSDQLLEVIRDLGVRPGDSLMLHSGFRRESGFSGNIAELTDVFLAAVGPTGDLLMPSLPYRSSTIDYLQRMQRFDVRKTPSQMGLVSEFFRHRDGVHRSLHPTHPVLALGPRAEAFVTGHESCIFPCGPGSPFDVLARERGKVMFFDVPFATFTFFHYLEHRVYERAGVQLYTEQIYEVPVVDAQGRERTVRTHAFSREVLGRRRFDVLEQELRKHRMIRTRRVGNTTIEVVDLVDVVDQVDAMTLEGRFFYAGS